MDCLLEVTAAVFRSAVVLDIDHIALLRHIFLPHSDAPEPGVLDHLRVRAAIDIDHYRVFAGRIEVLRLVETVIVVICAVSGRNGPEQDFTRGIILERVLRFKGQDHVSRLGSAPYSPSARHIEGRPIVEEQASVGAECDCVPALFGSQALRSPDPGILHADSLAAAARGHADLEKMVLDRRDFGGSIIDIVAEYSGNGNVGIARGKPAHGAESIAEIEVAVAVTVVGTVDEMVAVADEVKGIERLHVLVAVFREDCLHE